MRKLVLVATLMCLLVASCESPVDKAEDASSGDNKSETAVGSGMRVVDAGETSAPGGDLQVVGAGVSTAKHSYDEGYAASVVGVIRNPSDAVAVDVTVNLNLKDDTGRIVKAETANVSYIASGKEAYATTDVFLDDGVALPTNVEVQARARSFDNSAVKDFSFSDLRYLSDDFGGKVLGSIASSLSKDATNVQVQCAIFSGDQAIGGAYTFVDLVPAGRTTGFEASNGAIEGLNATSARCYGTLTSLSDS